MKKPLNWRYFPNPDSTISTPMLLQYWLAGVLVMESNVILDTTRRITTLKDKAVRKKYPSPGYFLVVEP